MDYVYEDMREMIIYEQNTTLTTPSSKSEVEMGATEIVIATIKIPDGKGSEMGAVVIEREKVK